MQKNHIAKHYLRQWRYFDSNLEYLNSAEAINIRILYSALKEMTPDERQFLADKYRRSSKPITDKDMAEEYDMTMKEYVDKRQKIETKLKPHIVKLRDEREKDLSEAIHLVYSR